MSLQSTLPRIFIAPHDAERLRGLARPLAQRGAWAGRFLLSELDRSVPCGAADLPADVVTMGSRVTYQVDGEEARSGLLVYPEDWIAGCGCISVLSPEGAALIGLRVGDVMRFRGPLGRDRTVRVTKVEARKASNVIPFRRRSPAPPVFTSGPEPDGAA